MASYTRINAYDADALYPQFLGLMQYGDEVGSDPRYAADAFNIETPGGVLQPAAQCTLLPPVLEHPIETLARLYRRWYTGTDDKELLVAASAGKLYAMLPNASSWTQLAMPSGISSYRSNVWSWVTYEINPEGSTASVDVLLLSNALDGMVMIRGDNLAVSVVPTPKKFGVIARYAERIWGGAITDDPDMLVYSAPFDPTDWRANVEIPEDGAGDINQPSWDGDSFTALQPFGSQLIAFKQTRVWRILGTDPGEYAFKEQFGGGAYFPNTIAVDSERIFMLSPQGVVVYDGLTVNPFQQEYACGIWKRVNRAAMNQSCGCIFHGRYYVALPLDGSSINNAVLIYNDVDRTWLLRTDVAVESFLVTDGILYFTSSTTPGRLWRWQEDSWAAKAATDAACRWVSPWSDLGAHSIVKGGFEVYFTGEVDTKPAELSFSIQTEKKTKTKRYLIQPPQRGREAKQKRLHFGGTGRRFRMIIEAPAGTPVWRLIGGVTIVAEIDPD